MRDEHDHHSRHHEGRQRQKYACKLRCGQLAPWRAASNDHRCRSQRSIARLAARERALGGVPVVEDATEHACEAARRLAVAGGPVIIDTPGFRSETTLT